MQAFYFLFILLNNLFVSLNFIIFMVYHSINNKNGYFFENDDKNS